MTVNLIRSLSPGPTQYGIARFVHGANASGALSTRSICWVVLKTSSGRVPYLQAPKSATAATAIIGPNLKTIGIATAEGRAFAR